MAEFLILRHEEGVRLNPDRLVELYARLGEAGAEDAVVRAVGDIVSWLTEIDRHAGTGDGAALLRSTERLSSIADDIGMCTLAAVARDVADTTHWGDRAGQGATLARLSRIADRSLAAIWDLRQATI